MVANVSNLTSQYAADFLQTIQNFLPFKLLQFGKFIAYKVQKHKVTI